MTQGTDEIEQRAHNMRFLATIRDKDVVGSSEYYAKHRLVIQEGLIPIVEALADHVLALHEKLGDRRMQGTRQTLHKARQCAKEHSALKYKSTGGVYVKRPFK